MKKSYKQKVIERLHFESDNDTKYMYPEEDIHNNMKYINWCERNGLSPYKCLLFLGYYMNGDYDITVDMPFLWSEKILLIEKIVK